MARPVLALVCLTSLCCAVQCRRAQPADDGSLAAGSSGDGGGGGGGSATAAARPSKRGVGWALTVPQAEVLGTLRWWYDWGTDIGDAHGTAASARAGIEFVPMQWGRWGIEQLAQVLQPRSRVILGFNEPNHRMQAALSPQEAAALWPQVQAVADQLGLRLGSPAAAPCGAKCVEPDPFKWWDAFFEACQGCRVDFLATHYYACNPEWLKSYLQQCRKYGRPVWLTEFACPNPGGPDVTSWRYMAQVLPLLDRDPWVERYAWFALETDGWLGTSNSLMNVSSNTLTDLGIIYISPPTAHPTAALNTTGSSGGGGGGSAGGGGGSGDASAAGVSEAPSGGGSGWAGEDAGVTAAGAAGGAWSERCEACIAHVRHGAPLAALPPQQRRYCSHSCGFWAEPVPRVRHGTGRIAKRSRSGAAASAGV